MDLEALRGKRALVTGASSGLGAEFARQLAAAGCDLYLVARREDRLRQLADELRAGHGVAVETGALDLAEPGAAARLHAATERAGAVIDVLINNAGVGVFGPFLQQDPAALTRMLRLDVVALADLTRLYVPAMVARGQGFVLQVGSLAGYQPVPGYAAYAAAKSFVLQLGEALSYELRGSGVRSTVLCPGTTDTPFFEASGQRGRLSRTQQKLMMAPRDVARAGLVALVRGRPSVVPGLANRLSACLVRFLPRRLAAAAAHRFIEGS